jgi:hypothetical protein
MSMHIGKRTWIGIAVVLVLLIAAAFVVPQVVVSNARETIEAQSCVRDDPSDEIRGPEKRFLKALDRLDLASRFPGFHKTASDLAVDAAMRCMGAYTIDCREFTDSGDTNMRPFCEGWKPFHDWLTGRVDDIEKLCPICR